MELLSYLGSTSEFYRASSGRIIKWPMQVWVGNPNFERLEKENAKAIALEAQILEKLGRHPRIVPFWGVRDIGIELSEASHGNLQAYIDSDNMIDNALRWKWTMQAIEAVVYVHEQGVIHSDLRPENFLVHGTVSSYMDSSPSLDLWLCDFGGSKCEELGLDGQTLPDDPFFDPREPWVSSPATDIFSLGSIIYTILTRRWPYREGASPSAANDKAAYETKVNALFMEGRFPDLSEQSGRGVIEGCWDHHYKTAKDVLDALKTEMESLGIEKLD